MKRIALPVSAVVALAAIVPLSQGNIAVAGVLYLALLAVAVLYMAIQHPAPLD